MKPKKQSAIHQHSKPATKPKKVYVPVPQNDEYYAKLDEIRTKPLRWLDIDDKQNIIDIINELSELSTDSKMVKIFKANAATLLKHFIHPFPMEGKPCPGHDGCRRWVWNGQISYDKKNNVLKAAHNRWSKEVFLSIDVCLQGMTLSRIDYKI